MKSPYAVCRDISDKLAVGPDNDSILEQFIRRQDKLRKINIKDYLNFLPK